MKPAYAILERKHRWTMAVGRGQDRAMTDPQHRTDLLFGSNLVAMVTPMRPDGTIDEAAVGALVDHLLSTGCDGIVVGGTTGESPTLTDAEAVRLVRAVAARSKNRARVVAGVGTYDTAVSVRRAAEAQAAGADALLLVCPYYSRPTQAGVVAHCRAVADATELPVMLYDVPARTGIALEAATLVELAGHPRIRAVKDAKGDLFEAMSVMSRTSLAYYSGIDELNLAYLACGATGVVSVVGNVVADRNAELIRAVRSGDLDSARAIQGALIPLVEAIMHTSQGAIMAKAALAELGILPYATVRPPLLESPPEHLQRLTGALATIAAPVRPEAPLSALSSPGAA
jgi:4-hydroxy-tetrahydrodipicolinate synthase